jgi:anhydro-N-acetylmuramic acid kinase
MAELYAGLMSGTSVDGIDAVLVEFNESQIKLIASHSHSIPTDLKSKLSLLSLNSEIATIDMLGEADAELGDLFADAINELLSTAGVQASAVTGIGSHGQTIRHRPDLAHRFTMQIGDANKISYKTGITTVADFRRKDMAADGEGAPLAPAFHQQVFHSDDENRAVLNIGGISNLSYIPKDKSQPCFGFDCGPGNILMDAWIQRQQQQAFDKNGEWAASAAADKNLVAQLMNDAFIHQLPPKSTGKEHYHLDWLEQQGNIKQLEAAQAQASLCQFTADSIIYAIENHLPELNRLIVCGGGVHNTHLMSLLKNSLPEINIESSEKHGIHPDWVEAIAFAWLARKTLNKQSGNLPAVTGASQAVILGAIYPAN